MVSCFLGVYVAIHRSSYFYIERPTRKLANILYPCSSLALPGMLLFRSTPSILHLRQQVFQYHHHRHLFRRRLHHHPPLEPFSFHLSAFLLRITVSKRHVRQDSLKTPDIFTYPVFHLLSASRACSNTSVISESIGLRIEECVSVGTPFAHEAMAYQPEQSA